MGTRPSVRRIPGLISHTDICVWSAATTAVVVSAVVFQPHGGLWRAHREELGGREGMEGGWRGGNVSVFQAHTQQKAAAVPWERRPAGQPLFTAAEHASSCHLASQSLNTPPPPSPQYKHKSQPLFCPGLSATIAENTKTHAQNFSMEKNDERLASRASRALTLAPAASDRFHLAKGHRRRLMRKSKLRHPHALPMHDCDRNILPARRPVCNFSHSH